MGKRRVGLVFGVWTFLLLVAVFGVVLNVPLVRGSGTIRILSNGNVFPSTAPIHRDGDLYTFTDNIYDEIVVERSNIKIDGNGYTLQGSGSGNGFYWYFINNVTIKNVNIKDFQNGGNLILSGYSNVSGNTITNSSYFGVYLNSSSNNRFYHNNFINNTNQVDIYQPHLYSNVWDDGYPSGGNYWSDHTSVDLFSGPY